MAEFVSDIVNGLIDTTTAHPVFVYAEELRVVTISGLEFGHAVHRAAHLLRPPGQGSDGQVVAVIALSDTVVYQAVCVGLITANFIPFPISPRNSPAAIVRLLHQTSCHSVLATCITLAPLVAAVKSEMAKSHPDFPLDMTEMPSLSQIYPHLGFETFAHPFQRYAATTRPLLDDICLILHSSGSTGFPKPIPHKHKVLVQRCRIAQVEELRDHFPHPIAAMALPGFHLAGLLGHCLQPIFGSTPAAVYPPTVTSLDKLPIFPTPDNILHHARKTNCRSLMSFPALLAAWAKSPDAIEYLKTYEFVGFSGGTLPERLGIIYVNAGVKLRSVYGSTEAGVISSLIPLPGDEKEWDWFRFSDRVKVRWAPQGDGTFELQILTTEQHELSYENLDDVRGFGTSDLFVNHPVKKHLWKVVGRTNDVIVHTFGEKTVPAPMEDIINSSPHVTGALMFGRERERAGILIEPSPEHRIDVQDVKQVAELRNKLWPIIEEANEIAPKFSRIFKEMILFTSADKPLARAGKGTVMRAAALNEYAAEIDAIYDVVSSSSSIADSAKMPTTWEPAEIADWLVELAAGLADADEIVPDVDLFRQGFDSLSVTVLQLRILGALRSASDPSVRKAADGLTQNLIYSYPTILQLSTFLRGLVLGLSDNAADPKEVLETMILKHTAGLVQPVAPPSDSAGIPGVILLTGSTGSLGSQILSSLLRDDRVAKIYAFNRPSVDGAVSSAKRHLVAFNTRGLDAELLTSPKLVFVEGQTDAKSLGLSGDIYKEIQSSVTLIIHNAWRLDFNLPLTAFENHVIGTRHLIGLALGSSLSPKFLFTSSIASAVSWDPAVGPCPEEFLSLSEIPEGALASSTGYGQSKYVAEKIIAASGLRAACLRIGQICGGLPAGAWATTDWLPILVKSSITLKKLPLADGVVSWIDFETVAHAVMDVAFSSGPVGPLSTMFNVVHPRPVSWNFVMSSLRDAIIKHNSGSVDLGLVSFSDWVIELESSATQGQNLDMLPGISLLEFFRRVSRELGPGREMVFSTSKTQAVSSAVGQAESIGDDQVEAWVKYW
ncbi:hypothetical protein GGX14DRAFT_525295, partial [Mycena pura]